MVSTQEGKPSCFLRFWLIVIEVLLMRPPSSH